MQNIDLLQTEKLGPVQMELIAILFKELFSSFPSN